MPDEKTHLIHGTPPAAPSAPHEHEHALGHEPKVKPLELFSDLVFVVALNIVASGLEEDLEEAHSLMPGLAIFVLRVFLLWHLWHVGTIVVNLSHATDDDGVLNPIDYLFTFGILVCSVFMARAVRDDDDDASMVVFFLLARALQSVSVLLSTRTKPRPPGLSEAHHTEARTLASFNALVFLPVEAAALGTAAALGLFRAGDAAPPPSPAAFRAGLWVWGGLAALILATRQGLAGLVADRRRRAAGLPYQPCLDMEHLAERVREPKPCPLHASTPRPLPCAPSPYAICASASHGPPLANARPCTDLTAPPPPGSTS